MARKPDSETDRLDEAARAGWLYYIAGNTQDEIAHKLGVSRQTAQRLVSLSVSAKLIKVRLDHPIGHCLELSERLKHAYGIDFCEVVPSDPESASATIGVAEAAAAELEHRLDVQKLPDFLDLLGVEMVLDPIGAVVEGSLHLAGQQRPALALQL